MAKKSEINARRSWTATDKKRLKGLAEIKTPIAKIARTLKRSSSEIIAKAAEWGIDVDDSNWHNEPTEISNPNAAGT